VGETSPVRADTAICPDPQFRYATFSAYNVLRWSKECQVFGDPTSVWNFDATTIEDIADRAEDEWRKVYGEDRLPFTWDGTEDESLKEELGQPPMLQDLPLSSLMPLFYRKIHSVT
jgi:hypothetical protein